MADTTLDRFACLQSAQQSQTSVSVNRFVAAAYHFARKTA